MVQRFVSVVRFIKSVRHETYDLIIIDRDFSNQAGFDALSYVRELKASLPVLMLSSHADATSIVESMRAGADDYVTRPVNEDVLLARVEALLRRLAMRDLEIDEAFSLGSYYFNPDKSCATFGSNEVFLTNREFALARLFFLNPQRPLSRQYLLECLWGRSSNLQTRTLDTHVTRLRAKLKLGSTSSVKLNSLYGFGYRLELYRSERNGVNL